MKLPRELSNKIIEFFVSLPNVNIIQSRRALLYSAGLDERLIQQINFSESPTQFFQLLVPTLISYGSLDDGRNALEAVLEASKAIIGRNRQADCEALIQELRAIQTRLIQGSSEPSVVLPSRKRRLLTKIIEWFTSVPGLDDGRARQALIMRAALDIQLQEQIEFSGPTYQFFTLLVPTLMDYGQLNDGRNALEAVLEATKQFVGVNKKADCDTLIQEIRLNEKTQLQEFLDHDTSLGIRVLQQLQEEIGSSLSLAQDDEDIESTQSTYIVDENKHIIGLNLSGNQLSALPNAITQLNNLHTIVLTNNQFEYFPLELLKLNDLRTLRLGNNQLTTLPKEVRNLKHLQYLSLNSNFFKTLPIEVNQLSHLQELDIRQNLIIELPKALIDTELKIKWGADGEHDGLYLEGNPFEKPPVEIVKRGREFVKIYFDSVEEELQTLKEVKVLLVGDGGAGKTSLVKQLLGGRFDPHESQTHGININAWYIANQNTYLKVNFWDFGGQEIMHATHQFFLSKRSLYVLVLDGRKDEDPEYWLKHIESFGTDSPILVVLNKIDDNPAFEVNRKFLLEKYRGIKQFLRVSCATGEGIDEFSKGLCRELGYIEIAKTIWPRNWFNLKAKLEKMEDNFISCEQYAIMCQEEEIEETSQEKIAEFLNDLGVILHFQDLNLLDTHVLKPEWVTAAVYKIINSNQLAQAQGILRLSALKDILQKQTERDFAYPPSKYKYIIDLMMKFELCYELDDKQSVLIPDLLGVQEPRFDFDNTQMLHFLFEYDFLPKSVIPRFIVKMHKDIKDELRWRTGVILEDSELHTIAVIKADNREKKISVAVQGEQKRDYFAIIRRTLRDINKSFEKLKCVELVPLPDNPDMTVAYRNLIGHERMGEEFITIGDLEKRYSVAQLLDGIESKEERAKHALADGGSVTNYYHIQEVKRMANIDVKVRDVNMEKGDFVIADTIQNSFNKVEASNAPDNLKELLKALTKDIEKITEQLPKEQAEEVADDLERFTDEATKEKPKRKWWEVSAKGLKEAAATVGAIGVSAMTNLEKILPILEKMS